MTQKHLQLAKCLAGSLFENRASAMASISGFGAGVRNLMQHFLLGHCLGSSWLRANHSQPHLVHSWRDRLLTMRVNTPKMSMSALYTMSALRTSNGVTVCN